MRKKKNIVLEEVLVENYAAEGKSLARRDGKVIFIENVVPGDVVDVRLSKNKKDWAEGYPIRFLSHSKERVTPFCQHFGVCGGCQWQMLPYKMQLQYKHQQVLDNLTRIGKVKLPEFLPIIGADNDRFYRNKLEFTFSTREFVPGPLPDSRGPLEVTRGSLPNSEGPLQETRGPLPTSPNRGGEETPMMEEGSPTYHSEGPLQETRGPLPTSPNVGGGETPMMQEGSPTYHSEGPLQETRGPLPTSPNVGGEETPTMQEGSPTYHRTNSNDTSKFGGGSSPVGGGWEGASNLEESSPNNDDDEETPDFYETADPTTYKILKDFVYQNRNNSTKAESVLWEQLRGKSLEGYKFRRQHIIGNFIADFVCLSKKLIIEVDGGIHQLLQNQISDDERTFWLEKKGYSVIRFKNEEVLFDTRNTLLRIKNKLDELPLVKQVFYERVRGPLQETRGPLPTSPNRGGEETPMMQEGSPNYHSQGPLPTSPNRGGEETPTMQEGSPTYHSEGPLPTSPNRGGGETPTMQEGSPTYHGTNSNDSSKFGGGSSPVGGGWEGASRQPEATSQIHQGVLGFHAKGFFDKVVHIQKCWLQDDVNNAIRNSLRQYALDQELSFYDHREHKGFLRNLQLRVCTTGEIMVNVVFGYEDVKERTGVLEFLKGQFPGITTIIYTINTKWNDSISDLEPIVYSGKGYVIEKLEDFQFKIGPKSFFQTNTRQAEKLYTVTRDFAELDGTQVVYDLYCGTGSIGIFCNRGAKKIIGVELIDAAIRDARENAAMNGIEHDHFFSGDVIDICNDAFFEQHGKPDVIITDPPRAGMHEKLVRKILEMEAPIVVYVSCNPATQARDLALLDEKYEVTKVQPVDMFPHTHHIENVVQLKRKTY